MDPRYNWPPQAYANGQYNPYAPQPQPNGYHQPQQQGQGYAPQYAPMPMQMPISQGYPPPQQYQSHPQVVIPRPPMQQQQQQQQQQQHYQHPQVVIPARVPTSSMPFQMQPPKIRHVQVQVPVQRPSHAGIPQFDGTADRRQSYNAPQAQAPPVSKPGQRSQSHQENEIRPQQRTSNTSVHSHSQARTPLHPQSTPQQKAPSVPRTPSQSQTPSRSYPPSQSQTPTDQYRSPSVQQSSIPRKSYPQVVIPKSSSSHLTPKKHVQTAQATPKALQPALPADLSVMLLYAADEYIRAARSMSSLIVREKKETDLRMYYKLMATAMGCMDTVLKDFSMMPRDEARLRLRYVSLMIEETDNTTDIDELISKQLSLCGRCRLQDLKYATSHLQARYQFKTNHRAGLKFLDKPIAEAETFQHVPWIYAFRFLKVSLTLQIPGRVEAVPTLQQLHAIMGLAEKRRDRAIYVACSVFEAMVHLRSSVPDRLEQAQRAIATARSQQLQLTSKEVGSFGTLIDIVDVTCSVQQGVPDNEKSTKLMQAMLDQNVKNGAHDDGQFTVLIERSSGGNLTQDTGGVFRKSADLREELVFAWLPREDLKTLCFHLSALDHSVHQKGMSYIKEAHARSRSASKRPASLGLPLALVHGQADWNRILDWQSMVAINLMACLREDQNTAHEALDILRKRSAKSPYNTEKSFVRALSYLSAVNDQRSGSLDSAYVAYCSDELSLPQKGASLSTQADIATLAALNRLLILRDPSHPQHHSANQLLLQIQQVCENHPNQYLRMAVRLATAIFSDDAPINRQKTLTQMASNRANEIEKTTHNREFVVIALCCFTARFFAGQVGDKSVQAAKAARQIARNWSPLWIAVAAGLCMSTFQPNGLIEDAQKAQMTFEAVRSRLPPALRGEDDVDAEGEDDADEMME
ncbi:hypothetical protein ACN47E_004864 [Coniothyrium glycines]